MGGNGMERFRFELRKDIKGRNIDEVEKLRGNCFFALDEKLKV